MSRLPGLLLWLFVINLGIAFGAGLYEARILVPQWLSGSPEAGYVWNAEAARQADTGLRFWVYATTVPLSLLTLGNLVAAWRVPGALGNWWMAAGMAALVDRVSTFAYFIPTMIGLMHRESLSQAEAVALATQWGQLDQLRLAAILVAWLSALKAYALFQQRVG
jgi:hypothetical protein